MFRPVREWVRHRRQHTGLRAALRHGQSRDTALHESESEIWVSDDTAGGDELQAVVLELALRQSQFTGEASEEIVGPRCALEVTFGGRGSMPHVRGDAPRAPRSASTMLTSPLCSGSTPEAAEDGCPVQPVLCPRGWNLPGEPSLAEPAS